MRFFIISYYYQAGEDAGYGNLYISNKGNKYPQHARIKQLAAEEHKIISTKLIILSITEMSKKDFSDFSGNQYPLSMAEHVRCFMAAVVIMYGLFFLSIYWESLCKLLSQ